jgi:hypothetical protein
VNLLLLAIAFRAWQGAAISGVLRVFAAIAVFSIELQLATWLHAGTIRSLRLLNLTAAVLALSWHAYRRARERGLDGAVPAAPPAGGAVAPGASARLPPLAAMAVLALAIGILAMVRPVTGADPYHLHRVDRITSSGTLAYDPAALDVKINTLAGVYELLLADLRIPGMSTALVRLHGLFGLGLFLLAIASVTPWVGVRRRWMLITLLVVPVAFHQLILVKNDLFGAIPAFVALTWVVTRGRAMSQSAAAAAAALAGFAVGIKISSAPMALVVGGFLAVDHRANWRTALIACGAGLAGGIAGGLLFTLVENLVVYGGAMQPYLSLGNRPATAGEALVGLGRFTLSLVDLGTVTPRVWPGRGGWGSTFGLPMVWAVVVLARHRREARVQRAVLAAGICFAVFGLTYPDADLAHRMVIAPGLLLMIIALGCADRTEPGARPLRLALIAVIILSTLQLARSAALYFARV